MLGYTVDELMGLSVDHVIPPREIKDLEDKKAGLLSRGSLPVYERVFCRKDGSEIVAEVNAAMVYNSEGKPLHFHSIVRDITERKRAEGTLEIPQKH